MCTQMLTDTSADLRRLLHASLTQQLCLLAVAADSTADTSLAAFKAHRRPLGRANSAPSLAHSSLLPEKVNSSLPIPILKVLDNCSTVTVLILLHSR